MTPDVNVLVAASRSDHPHHRIARGWLEDAASAAASGGTLILMPMVLASFLRLVSSPCWPLEVSTLRRSALSGRACGNFASRSSSKEMPCQMHGLPLRRSTSVSTWLVLIVISGS
jgi:hypothetical protein